MRTDCQHYESRTYPSGDTVRKCDLDLAPEAPWRCPADCPAFKRRSDVGWSFGSLAHPPPPAEPPGLGEGAAEILDHAEDILNEIGPQILAEIERERAEAARPWWKRLGRRGRARRRGDQG